MEEKEHKIDRKFRVNELDHWFLLALFIICIIMIFIVAATLTYSTNEIKTTLCEAKYGAGYVYDGFKGCALKLMG